MRRWIDGDISGSVSVVVAVPYFNIVYAVVSFPVFRKENVSSYRTYDGAVDPVKYSGSGGLWYGGYGKDFYFYLYPAEPAVFLVCFKR